MEKNRQNNSSKSQQLYNNKLNDNEEDDKSDSSKEWLLKMNEMKEDINEEPECIPREYKQLNEKRKTMKDTKEESNKEI